MTWRGASLSPDQRDVRAAMDSCIAQQATVLEDTAPEEVARVIGELAELGFWALGAPESVGGGDADRLTTLVALERLGRTWPALGWACSQTHAGLRVLATDSRVGELAGALSAGEAAVAVVDAASDHVRVDRSGDALTGLVPRVDAAHPSPHLLVLVEPDTAVLVLPGGVTARPLRRTGFAGAMTRSIEIAAAADNLVELHGVDVGGARSLLRLGAAAVAAGIAGAAADDARDYAAVRRQFGDTLIALPTVRLGLLEQATRAAVALNAVLAAPEDELAALAVARDACEAAVEVAAAALQSHGGYGYLVEYGVEGRLRDAVSLRAATDVQGTAGAAARSLAGHAQASPRKDKR